MMRTAWLAIGVAFATACASAQDGPTWEWETDGDLQGWGREHSLTSPQVEDGLLRATMTGADPWIVGPDISVDAAAYPFLRLRVRVDHWAGGGIYWQTADEPTFAQERLVSFRLTSDTEFSELLIDLREHPEWRGAITGLRLDPLDVYPSAVSDFLIEIDSLAFVADEERPAEVVAGRLTGPREAVVPLGETIELEMTVENVGGQPAEGVYGVALAPSGMAKTVQARPAPESLGPGQTAQINIEVTPRRAGPVPVAVTVLSTNHPPVYGALRCFAEADEPVEGVERVPFGAGELTIEKRGETWGPLVGASGTLTARIPAGVGLFYVDDQDILQPWEPAPATVMTRGGELVAAAADDVAAGRVSVRASGHPGLVELAYELRPTKPLRVAACWGPTLYMDGPEKDDAVFPGLEWLTADEVSSSDLDCQTEDRFRYVPHPNKVTIPAMAVRRGGTMLGLMWDARQTWLGERDRPSAVFSAPNTFEARDNHLMALMAPSVPEAMEENRTLAAEPVVVEPASTVRLEAALMLREAESSADIALDWIDRFGLPEPAPTGHDTLMDAFAFTVHGYLDALWIEEEKAWRNGLGPPAEARAYYPFMRDMTIAGRVLPEGEVRDRVREQVALARGDITGNFGVETAVYDGGLIPLVHQRLRGGAGRVMQTQGPEGGWGYEPGPPKAGGKHDPRDLGEAGQVELGTCARNARVLLQFARFAQDEETLAAGLRALQRMREFDVPRAAQVWEVPVHTPDVLAAAQAVRAYVEGFRATGDEQWIPDAARWARLGLPFIYLWDSGEYDCMTYGSIPVFGATWFTGAWFGRLVQWNGSEYAAALLELAPYDNSLDWRTIARGLTASAANQQAHEGYQRGLYTDATNLMNGSVADYWVPPYHHCEALLGLMGVPVAPATAFMEVDGKRVAVTSAGKVTEAASEGAAVRFVCGFPDDGRHFVLIASCPDVEAVTVNGEEAAVGDVLTADGTAWQHDAAAEMVEVRIEGGAEAVVELTLRR